MEALSGMDFEKLVTGTGILPGNDSLIYPSTADILGLQFVDQQTTYRFQLTDNSRQVVFREGLEMQIEYYMKARELLRLYYVDNSRF